MKHDQLTSGWQIFLYNVTVDEQKGLLCFGLAVIDPGIKEKTLKLYNPDRPAAAYTVELPPEYLDSKQTIVHLRKSIFYQRTYG
jgi:hypothetical protein